MNLPIVYSCSGCSNVAQMANYIALQLDKWSVAEMSYIAGVDADVPHLLRAAYFGRPIIALDDCPLTCTNACLTRHGIEPNSFRQLNQAQILLARVLTKVEERYHSLLP